MLIVLPVCQFDEALALLNAQVLRQNEPSLPLDFDCLITSDSGYDTRPVETAFSGIFRSLKVFQYPRGWNGVRPNWPQPQNWAWQESGRYIERRSDKFKTDCWLWWEQDAVPLYRGAFATLAAAHSNGRKPFSGAIAEQLGHKYMAGVGIYPVAISKHCERALLNSLSPFDLVAGALDGIVRAGKVNDISQYLQHDLRASNDGLHFETTEDLRANVRQDVVMYHRCNDGSLQAVLLNKPTKQRKRSHSFYHSGNLGDIIYALAAIKATGKKSTLMIGPEQRDSSPCGMPVTDKQFQLLNPLLEAQSYLSDIVFRQSYCSEAQDLNKFRNSWDDWPLRQQIGIHTLCQMHFHLLRIATRFKSEDTWLRIPASIETGRIVIHRSARYNAVDFPWKDLVQRHRHKLLFVGLESEHKEFETKYGRVSFWGVRDFLEMAQLTAGAKAFVGNQSFPCAIALGCGQRVFQEQWSDSPDCAFERPGKFLTQKEGLAAFEKWL